MIKILYLLLGVVSINATRQAMHTSLTGFEYPETMAHDIRKILDRRCCQRFGGIVCGTRFPECCTEGCTPGVLGGYTCLGEKIKINTDVCPDSCKNRCER